jgi:hypothetical protein
MTDRKFYRTVIAIEVLSEEPIPAGMELENIVHDCVEGSYSMRPLKHKEIEINGRVAAQNLIRQGSDPSFFQLTKNGNDVE